MNTPQLQTSPKKYGMIKKSSKSKRQFFDSAEWSLNQTKPIPQNTEIYKPYSVVDMNETRKKSPTPTTLKEEDDSSHEDQ